ncbi:Putative Regulatory protein CII [Xanthomonas phage Suba]|uniref:Regulatory protein CII n=1 Tax=Xanthomonas phage Suba TaxID=2674975 RepID=A0A679KAN5_9CAUD|nr:Putative Regulatory protein CII [Xanthomonas phage Suba]CAA2409812.1 Putative Regulatory protein CII [Xanthomonas phage Suba]
MAVTDKAHPILIETIARIRRRPCTISIEELAASAGLGVRWVGSFSRSEIADPSFNKVMAIKECLDNLGIK